MSRFDKFLKKLVSWKEQIKTWKGFESKDNRIPYLESFKDWKDQVTELALEDQNMISFR